MIEHTLNYQHSVRESAEVIKAICISKISGLVATYDSAALRLWTLKKQIRSHRLESKYNNLLFVNMTGLDELDGLLLWLAPKKSSVTPGGVLKLFSFDLTPVQEICLNLLWVDKFSACLQQKDFVLIDGNNTAKIFHVDVLVDSLDMGPKAADPLGTRKKEKLRAIALFETQSIDMTDRKTQDLQMVNKNLFVAVGSGSILLFSRQPSSTQRGTITSADEYSTIDDNLSLSAPSTASATSTAGKQHAFVHSGTIPMAYNSFYKRPNVIRQVGSDKLLIGFDDGTIQIIICSALQESLSLPQHVDLNPTPVIAAKLCEFRAHSVNKSVDTPGISPTKCGVLMASTCPWEVLLGGNGYMLELLTVGSDNRLVHWGVRQKDAHSSVTFVEHSYPRPDEFVPGASGDQSEEAPYSVLQLEYPMEVDLLGEYALPIDPVTSGIGASSKPHHLRRSLALHSQLLPFELTVLGSLPSQKRLVCSFGGMLLFFSVVQPHRKVGATTLLQPNVKNAVQRMPRKNDISSRELHRLVVASCRGPDLAPMQSLDFNSSQLNTLLLLKEDGVELVAVESGEVLHRLSTSHLAEHSLSAQSPHLVHPNKKFSSVLVRDSVAQKELNELEGRPCVLLWCNLSQLLLVGYTAGGVGVVHLDAHSNGFLQVGSPAALSESMGHAPQRRISHVNSNSVHDSEITVMVTVRHELVSKKKDSPARSIVALLLGDKSGRLSLWQLSPARKSSALLSSGRHHLGSVVCAHSCLLDSELSHRVLVTACVLGVVKVWKLELHGDLTLIAFVNTIPSASIEGASKRLNSLVVVPSVNLTSLLDQVAQPSAVEDDLSMGGSCANTADQSLQSALSFSVKEKVPSIEHKVCCVCGFSDGVVESWWISTSRLSTGQEPMFTYQDTFAPVAKLVRLPRESGSNLSLLSDCESVFLPDEAGGDEILCTFADSSVAVLRLSSSGELRRLVYFTLPADRLNNAIVSYNFPLQSRAPKHTFRDLECVFVSDFCGYEALLSCSPKAVPLKWHNLFHASAAVLLMPDMSDQILKVADVVPFDAGAVASREHTQITSTSHMTASHSESRLMSRESRSGGADEISLAEGSHMSHSQSLATMRSFRSEKRQQFVGSMESMQRIVSSELHFAKKDQRLLELFIQNQPSADGTVSPENTVDIVYHWLNTDKIGRETIWQLFRLLEIQDDDRLKFIEVAKVAAVVASAMHRSLGKATATEGAHKSLLPYRKMKSSAVKVTYNSMGERIFQKVELPSEQVDGIFDGLQSAISRIWNKQDCRVLTQAESKDMLVKPLQSKLLKLPEALSALLVRPHHPVTLPASWVAGSAHWIDPWRAVRTARTLLDIRSAKQHECAQSAALNKSSSKDVPSFPQILVQHFQSSFGEGSLGVVSNKVVHFLEACLQYQHHPVLNLLSRVLRLDVRFARETIHAATVWLCVEARSLLSARGSVVQGGLVQPYSSDQNYKEVAVQEGVALQVRAQHVSRADALNCVDEMLRVRGRYGSAVYLHVFAVVQALPGVGEAGSLVDLEAFLEVLFSELVRFEQLIRDSENNLFGELALPVAVTAVSRDINSKGRRQVVIDDQDFGPHHSQNLIRIKELLVQCILCDEPRLGVMSITAFSELVNRLAFLGDTLGRDNKTVDVVGFIRVCGQHFLSQGASADEMISYVDCVATIIAWESHTQGEESLQLSALVRDIPTILRGIEVSQANELVTYLGAVQTLPSLDPLWTMGTTLSTTIDQSRPAMFEDTMESVQSHSSLLISREGNWDPNMVSAAEEPGLLLARKALLLPRSSVLMSNKKEAQVRDKEVLGQEGAQQSPKVLRTDRELSTMFGETLRPLQPLTASALFLTNLAPDDIQERAASPNSYSRSVGKILSADPQLEWDDRAASLVLDDNALPVWSPAQLVDSTQTRLLTSEDRSYNLLRRDDSVATNDSNYEHFSISFGGSSSLADAFASNDDLNRSLATAEVERRLSEKLSRETELDSLLAQERAAFALRKEAKELLHKAEMREARRKERLANEFADKALEERCERNQKARKLAEAAALLEEQDKLAREREIQRIIDKNRARSQQKLSDKSSRAQEVELERLQQAECVAMRREDLLSAACAKWAKESARREAAEKARKEQEELERQIVLLQAQMVIDAPAPATVEKAPEHTLPPEENEANEEENEIMEDEEEDPRALLVEEEEEEQEEEVNVMAEDLEVRGLELLDDVAEETVAADMEVVTVARSVDMDVMLEDNSAEAEQPVAVPLTAAQMRMKRFVDSLQRGLDDHRSHPRRENGRFFIPQTFSSDIVFDPFATACSNFPDPLVAELKRKGWGLDGGEEEEGDGYKKFDPFADIRESVKSHKRQLEKSRKLLFATSLDDVPTQDWMKLFRTGAVDWNPFFAGERMALEANESAKQRTDSQEIFDFQPSLLPSSSSSVQHAHEQTVYNALTDSMESSAIPPSLLEMPDDLSVEITPLPFGKVLAKRVVGAGAYQYFQVELLEESVVTTLELRCLKGLASMYLSYLKLPSVVKFEHRADCSLTNNRLARLSFVPQKKGTYLIAVHSPETGAQFDIWAYASDDPSTENPRIAHVNSLLRKFRHLAEHEDELQTHFPRLEIEGAQLAEKEAKARIQLTEARRSVYLEMNASTNSASDPKTAAGVADGAEDAEGDMENMELFVVKAGRFAMRKEAEMVRQHELRVSAASSVSGEEAEREVDVVFDVRDPNLHSDLFSKPALPSRSKSLAMFAPLAQDLSVDEELHLLSQHEDAQQQHGAESALRASSMMDFYSRTLSSTAAAANEAHQQPTSSINSALQLPSISSSRQINSLQRMYTHLETPAHTAAAGSLSKRVTKDARLRVSKDIDIRPISYKLRKFDV